MKLILNNLKVKIDCTQEEIVQAASDILNRHNIRHGEISLCRKSLDARRKNNIHYVCAVSVETELTAEEIRAIGVDNIRPCEEIHLDIQTKKSNLKNKIIVAGTGPCGLFCGYILAKAGLCPLVIDRGADVEARTAEVSAFWQGKTLNPYTNVQFGEGGAGTFSDGKLTTRIGDPLQRVVLEEFVKFGAPSDILYKAKPHIGTDKLKNVVKNIREEIKRLGGRVLFNSCLEDITVKNGELVGAVINGREYDCKKLILAIGHSSRDTYEMLYKKGVLMESKAFAAGVRIEHTQKFINKMQYGRELENPSLPPADYRMVYNGKERSCYSFCMCPGGYVVNASSEEGCLVVNGMSEYARNGKNANSALVVTVTPKDFENENPLCGIEFQRKYEHLAYLTGGGNFSAPVQLAKDFAINRVSTAFEEVSPSFTGKTAFADLRECLPKFITSTLKEGLFAFENTAKGYMTEGAVLTGVEMRTSAPLRILRNQDFESVYVKGLYPAGEGAGYAGGIMSAAVDGIKIAQKIINMI